MDGGSRAGDKQATATSRRAGVGGEAVMTLRYSARGAAWVLALLLLVELVFAGIHLLTSVFAPDVPWGPIRNLFDVSSDLSIPSWFSSVQLFVVAAVLLVAAANQRGRPDPPAWFLATLGVAFLFLSVDEGAVIHERLTGVVSNAGFTWLLFRGGHGGWIAIYGVLAVVAVVVSWRWLRTLWMRYRREAVLALIGLAVYVGGAVAVEILSFQFSSGESSRVDAARNTVEEFLEMSGVSVLLYAALLLALRLAPPGQDRGGQVVQRRARGPVTS